MDFLHKQRIFFPLGEEGAGSWKGIKKDLRDLHFFIYIFDESADEEVGQRFFGVHDRGVNGRTRFCWLSRTFEKKVLENLTEFL